MRISDWSSDVCSSDLAAAEVLGRSIAPPPVTTALGALLHHITGGADDTTFQPMNVNFGLFPPLDGRTRKNERKAAMVARARMALGEWMEGAQAVEPAASARPPGLSVRSPRLQQRPRPGDIGSGA